MSIDSTDLSGCTMIGEFDEIGNRGLPETYSIAEAVPTVVIGDFVESGMPQSVEREFKVLLQDQRMAIVRGHELRYLPLATTQIDDSAIAIVFRSGAQEVIVGLFPSHAVNGIFSGDIQLAKSR